MIGLFMKLKTLSFVFGLALFVLGVITGKVSEQPHAKPTHERVQK